MNFFQSLLTDFWEFTNFPRFYFKALIVLNVFAFGAGEEKFHEVEALRSVSWSERRRLLIERQRRMGVEVFRILRPA